MGFIIVTEIFLFWNLCWPQVPLAEVITDFFDQLKSRTKGYSSMSFTEIGFRTDNLVKLDIRINGEEAPPLATIVHRDKAHDIGKKVCDKLKELIPRQQFKVCSRHRVLFGWYRCHKQQLRWRIFITHVSHHDYNSLHSTLQVPIQACIGSKPVASAQISALLKDVLAKCYGGDISRKKKLLAKQAKGKKRMKAMGKVNVPQEAFMAVIQIND